MTCLVSCDLLQRGPSATIDHADCSPLHHECRGRLTDTALTEGIGGKACQVRLTGRKHRQTTRFLRRCSTGSRQCEALLRMADLVESRTVGLLEEFWGTAKREQLQRDTAKRSHRRVLDRSIGQPQGRSSGPRRGRAFELK